MLKTHMHVWFLCEALLREENVAYLQNGKFEIRAVIKYFCMKVVPYKEIY